MKKSNSKETEYISQLEKEVKSLNEVLDKYEEKYDDIDYEIADVFDIIKRIKYKTEYDNFYCRYALFNDLEEIEDILKKYKWGA